MCVRARSRRLVCVDYLNLWLGLGNSEGETNHILLIFINHRVIRATTCKRPQ